MDERKGFCCQCCCCCCVLFSLKKNLHFDSAGAVNKPYITYTCLIGGFVWQNLNEMQRKGKDHIYKLRVLLLGWCCETVAEIAASVEFIPVFVSLAVIYVRFVVQF